MNSQPDSKRADAQRRIWAGVWLLIIAVSAAPYLSSLKGMPVWDDYGILNGGGIGGGQNLIQVLTEPFNYAYYRPVVSLSFYVDHLLFGPSPFFFHQTNVLLHLVSTALVGWLAWLLFHKKAVAAAGALLFGVQPVQAGAVAWIGGRTDVLCGLFVIAYLSCLVKMARADTKSLWWAGGGALMLLLAGLCKEQAMAGVLAAPLALTLLSQKGDKLSRQSWVRLASPFLAACAGFAVLWVNYGQRAYSAQPHAVLEQAELGGRGFLQNVILLLTPNPAALHTFTFETSRAWGILPVILGWAALVASLWAVVRYRKEHPELVWLAVAALLYVIPVSSIIPMPSLHTAPYRVAIAGPAVALILAGSVFQFKRPFSWASTAMISIWWVMLTIWAAPFWKSEKELFGAIIQHDPWFIVGRNNYAGADGVDPAEGVRSSEELLNWIYGSEAWRDQEGAVEAFDSTPAISDRLVRNVGNATLPKRVLAGVHESLAVSLFESERFAEAETASLTALHFNPRSARSHAMAGDISLADGRLDTAISHFEAALSLNPNDLWPYISIADAYSASGRPNDAMTALETAAEKAPWHGGIWSEIIELSIEQGWHERAEAAVESAVQNRALSTEAAARIRTRLEEAAQSLPQ